VEGRDYQSNCSKVSRNSYDIYKLNPDAQSGLKPNSVLLIGKQSVATTPVASASKRMQLLARILLLPKTFIRNRKTYIYLMRT
jgi:hypothetical protein